MFFVDWFLRLNNWLLSRRDSLAKLQDENERLREDAAKQKSHYESLLKIREQEMRALTEVIERDRERVQAETAGFVAKREASIRPVQAGH